MITHGQRAYRQPLSNQSQASRPAQLGGSTLVALGILISRISGLARERALGHFFGVETVVADAFRAAVRIPNLLSTLFGEGVLSASFVTVYAKLRAEKDEQASQALAASVFGILCIVSSALALAGILLAPVLTDFIAIGFTGAKRELTIQLVRVLFPGTGLLVLSAWCLGVLNSHRRFLLSYVAPVALNVTVIVALALFGSGAIPERLVIDTAWAYVIGSALQFLVQLPQVLRFLPGFRPALDFASRGVRQVLRNFGPIFLSRGVVQISATVDQMIASLLPTGAVAALSCGQVISVLPVSLFSMSISAAQLPALSSAMGTDEEIATQLRTRLSAGLRRIAFLIIPSAVAFLLLGDVLAAALYQSGRFHYTDALDVWAVLAGSALGLLATSLGRLYSSTFYALLDTRTPLRYAVLRVFLTITLGYVAALWIPAWLGVERKWGVAGLTASAGIAGWVEFSLLRLALKKRIGATPLPKNFAAKLWSSAFASGSICFAIKSYLGHEHPILLALLVVPIYGAIYFWASTTLGVDDAEKFLLPVIGRLARLRTRASAL